MRNTSSQSETEAIPATDDGSKTVLTEIGPVETQVPRDTGGSFDPQIVKKGQRRLTGVDEIVLSLSAKGLTTGEIAAHFDDDYGASVSRRRSARFPRALRAGRCPHRSHPPGSDRRTADASHPRHRSPAGPASCSDGRSVGTPGRTGSAPVADLR